MSFPLLSAPTLPVNPRDDRGRTVPLFDGTGTEESHAAARRAAHDALARATIGRRLPAGRMLAIALLATLLAISTVLLKLRFGMSNWAGGIFGVFIGLAAGMLAHREARRAAAGEIRSALLASGSCASCGYPLRPSPAAEDGQTLCPECGAAWRLPVRQPAAVPPHR